MTVVEGVSIDYTTLMVDGEISLPNGWFDISVRGQLRRSFHACSESHALKLFVLYIRCL
jgi:hypothetical protein